MGCAIVLAEQPPGPRVASLGGLGTAWGRGFFPPPGPGPQKIIPWILVKFSGGAKIFCVFVFPCLNAFLYVYLHIPGLRLCLWLKEGE